jgi:hypothetical protein
VTRSPPAPISILRPCAQPFAEYEVVAETPRHGFHFHTGRPLARMLGYKEQWLAGVPQRAVESFAGTGNPFSLGALHTPASGWSTSAAAPGSIA